MYSYIWSKYIYRICTCFLLNVKENNSVHLFYNDPKFFNTFRIISDPLESFAPNSLGPFQLLQGHFLLFFWLRSRNIRSLSLLFSNLVCNFLSFFVPRPVFKELIVSKRRRYQIVSFGISKYFGLNFTTITGRGTKKERKLHTRFEKRSERLEMLRDLAQKKRRKCL